jgi:hypothetical protein
MVRSLLVWFVFLLAVSPLASAEEIGRVPLNGRTVILQSDGTWAYDAAAVSAADTNCDKGNRIKSKKLDLSVCVSLPWKVDSTPSEAMEFQLIEPDQDIFAGFITERTSMQAKLLRKAILGNAASAIGVREEDVPIVKESKISINGTTWDYVEYDVNLQGAKFRFGNYYVSFGDKGVAQIVFWCSLPYFDANRPTIEALVATVKTSAAP